MTRFVKGEPAQKQIRIEKIAPQKEGSNKIFGLQRSGMGQSSLQRRISQRVCAPVREKLVRSMKWKYWDSMPNAMTFSIAWHEHQQGSLSDKQ